MGNLVLFHLYQRVTDRQKILYILYTCIIRDHAHPEEFSVYIVYFLFKPVTFQFVKHFSVNYIAFTQRCQLLSNSLIY